MKEIDDFDKEFAIEGRWTERQKELMSSLMDEIIVVLKKRFPDVVEQIKLDYFFPKEKIGIKFKTKFLATNEKYLGELQSLHLLNAFKEEPDATENLLKTLFNNHAVMLYEETIHYVLSKLLRYLVKRANDEDVEQDGSWIAEGMKIIPVFEVPENVIIMNANTFDKFKDKR
ncbi:hypothetical protein DRJ17_00860 [Candidatus Woesearchaeota archaeon]|nr:MAG: hypothetical protein DRJ17_00860 [Candidatus Woesearchaeota archaeon]